jgi:hypothetical protein
MTTSSSKQCLCSNPPVIDLTHALHSEADFSLSSTSSLLASALARWGWCHISVDAARQNRFPSFDRSNFIHLFDDVNQLTQDKIMVYRGRSAESGSSVSVQAEPKQSLEVQRCCGQHQERTVLHDHVEAMHQIAVTVTKLLGMPNDTLLQEQPCHCDSTSRCNVDLLRVFLYDPVGRTQLGSSPHTDWGSWTVVWQDDTGGLQAYCPHCKTYVNVEAPPVDSKLTRFVVHVGDVTSLALGHAASSEESTAKHAFESVSFPSPLHRVLCPEQEPRVSLVYFCYPPPSLSLREMEDRLAQLARVTKATIDYGSYYLLRNQTPGGGVEDPKAVYQRIRAMPLSQVFEAKWAQVQRDY